MATFPATRDALHALASYVVAPARKARTGRIGLRPTGDGFGTPPFDDGTRIVVWDDRLGREPGSSIPVTTLRAAAAFLEIELSADPGVGADLPPYAPDEVLAVDVGASRALAGWFDLGARVLDALAGRGDATVSEPQLWPEHFDLAVVVELDAGQLVNVGFSAGDGFADDPYVYVGPHDTGGLTEPFWNAPFGAYATYDAVHDGDDPVAAASAFVTRGLDAVRRR